MATRAELGHPEILRARQLLKTLQLRTVEELNIEEIAALHERYVIDGGLSGAQWRLVRHQNRGLIRVQTCLIQQGRAESSRRTRST